MKLHTVCLVLIAYIYINGFAKETHALCSLDQMKKHAIEACEYLFRSNDGARNKRSYKHNEVSDSKFAKFGYKKHYVRRHNYPNGGYLKMDQFHFDKLSDADVYPPYKSRRLPHILDSAHTSHGDRLKRHLKHYNNIPYCCMRNCEEDFFC